MLTNFMWTIASSKSKAAFTLIEMLVVIFVLGIGILSISLLISRNLSLVKNIHTQTTATILAREGIEMTYNVRDTNNLLWYRRNCAQRISNNIEQLSAWSDICQDYMRTGDTGQHRFIIEWWLGNQSQIIMSGIVWDNFSTLFENSKLYLTGITNIDSITWYTHIWYGDSNLARYVEFTGINSLPINSPISNNDIHHIKSVVLYKLSSTQTWEVVLESFITNKE